VTRDHAAPKAPSRRRSNRLAAAALWAAALPLVLVGCSNDGTPAASVSTAGSRSFEEGASDEPLTPPARSLGSAVPPTGAAPSAMAPAAADPCTLLSAVDLDQPGSPAVPKPDTLDGWKSGCKWASMQFKAGYTPPPQVDRGAYGPDGTGDLGAAADSAKGAAEVLNNSAWVIVRVVVRDTPPPRPQPSSYTLSGRRIELIPPPDYAPESCATATAWGEGSVMVVVSDATGVTPPCDTAKRLIALIVDRAPG
jgi:hypothetical protein